jgi:phosphatidylserine/phosphatidylglycerophosphate/cardiolipin synthase-like enzyme
MTEKKKGSSGRNRAASTASTLSVFLLLILFLAFLQTQGLLDDFLALIGIGPKVVAEAPAGEWYTLYFTSPSYPDEEEDHFGGVDEKLVALINDAQSSIHVAAYELDLDNVAEALIEAHERGVPVRLVTDTDNVDERAVRSMRGAGIPIVEDGREAIMHNKFVIIDEEVLWTGSGNLTENDTHRNNNNAIVIRSPALAQNYRAEFEEMFEDGEFGPDSSPDMPYQQVFIDEAIIENYFAPENEVAAHIIGHLQAAEQSIYFMAFSFTDDRIGDVLRDKHRAGLEVKGVLEYRGSETEYSEYGAMKEAGIDVLQDGNPYIMHHKIFIIDGQRVILGSFNFSRSADESNDENILIITDPDITQAYLAEFQRIYAQASTDID